MGLEIGQVAILVSVLLGALAVPFLGEHITISAVDDYREGLVPILNESTDKSMFTTSDAKDYLGSVKKSFGADVFSFETETAFGIFRIEIRNDDKLIIKQTLNNAGVSVERVIENDGVLNEIWVLSTNEFKFKSSRNFTTVVEEFHNPEGSCKRTREYGAVTEECTGEMNKLDDKRDDAKEMLEEYIEKIQNVTATIEIPDIQSDDWDF